MNRTIDFTYKEISDNKEGKYLFGYSTQTVKKCIAHLEKNYFRERNVFRNTDLKSDFLFRYEIKGLLLLLIKLELEDTFGNEKASLKGISKASIEKIKKSYEEYKKYEDLGLLRKFETYVLKNITNTNDALYFMDTMQNFQDSMTNFLIGVVRHHHNLATNFFEDIVDQFDRWSRSIVSYCYDIDKIRKSGKETKIMFYEMNLDSRRPPAPSDLQHGIEPVITQVNFRNNKDLNLNLKIVVIKAINNLTNTFYKIDENGICQRRSLYDIIEKSSITQNVKQDIKNILDNISNEYDINFNENFSGEDLKDSQIEDIQETLVYVYNTLYYTSKNKNTGFYKKSNTLEREYLETMLSDYLNVCYSMQYAAKKDCKEYDYDIFETMIDIGNKLHMHSYKGCLFREYLQKSEHKMVELAIKNNWPNPASDFVETFMKIKIKIYVQEFIDEASRKEKQYLTEYNQNTEQFLEDTEYEYISDNVKLLKKQCSDIISNMLSMILKIESKNIQENDDFLKIFNDDK